MEVKVTIGGTVHRLDHMSVEQLENLRDILNMKISAVKAINILNKAIEETQ